MNYTSYRNLTHASLSGGSVEFKKGVPTYAPPRMHAELVALGCIPEEQIDEPEALPSDEPTDPTARETALFAMFAKLTQRGRREDFTAVGAPHVGVLAEELGWAKLQGKERDAAWTKWTLEQLEKDD